MTRPMVALRGSSRKRGSSPRRLSGMGGRTLPRFIFLLGLLWFLLWNRRYKYAWKVLGRSCIWIDGMGKLILCLDLASWALVARMISYWSFGTTVTSWILWLRDVMLSFWYDYLFSYRFHVLKIPENLQAGYKCSNSIGKIVTSSSPARNCSEEGLSKN